MMNDRECFRAVMEFEIPDKFPVMEFMGFWPEVHGVWADDGVEKDENLFQRFGLVERHDIPINFNFVPAFEEQILKETDHHILMIDETGCTKKIEKNSSAMPHYIEFPIKGRDDFEAIKERMNLTDTAGRYPSNWDALVKEYRNRDYVLGLVIRGPFAFCRDFVQFEQLMMMVYDDYDLVKEMMEFQVDFTMKLWERALADVEVDYIYLGEDMAYKTGPMFSPQMLMDLVAPLYIKLTDYFKSFGVNTIFLDSDGHVTDLLPLYVNSGITGILPIERAAGMDAEEVRKAYPQLRLVGGVDKMKIAEGGQAIDEEIEKIQRIVGLGGYLPSFDHSVPPIVPYENYRLYMDKLTAVL